MLETTCQLYHVQLVTELLRCSGGEKVVFRNGLEATLPADHPDHDILLRTAERGLVHREPIAVQLDANGRIVDLSYTYRVTVRCIKDDNDPERLLVAFWGFSAICYLTRDHPEFERNRTTLLAAIASGSPVCFANYSWPVEGEKEIWNKIMDVRPAQGLEAPLESTGARADRANGAADSARAGSGTTDGPAAAVKVRSTKMEELSPEQRQFLNSRVRQVSEELKARFHEAYQAWKETWDDPLIAVSSDPASRTQTPAFRALISLGPEILPLLMEKLTDPEEFFALQAVDRLIRPQFVISHAPDDPAALLGEQGRAIETVKQWVRREP